MSRPGQFIADTQQNSGIKHVVRQGNGGAHCDNITADQAQLHAWRALGNAIAHCRNAACDLAVQPIFWAAWDLIWSGNRHGLVGREHVVVRADDGNIGRLHQPQGLRLLADRRRNRVPDCRRKVAGARGLPVIGFSCAAGTVASCVCCAQ